MARRQCRALTWLWQHFTSGPRLCRVPFPDELARGLAVVAYDRRWPGDFTVLARTIQDALGPAAVRVSHVGSTSVPGLAAKDCIDVQVETQALDEDLITSCFGTVGFRLRPEPWNRAEATPGGPCPKLVFAPPEGERASNIHVVEAGSEAARCKLLFRDFLRANDGPGMPGATSSSAWPRWLLTFISTARPKLARRRSC